MPVAPAGLRWHEETDFGVVGAGACGLAAAHAAAGDGLRIMVWERDKEPGGTTALSNGCVPGAGSRLQREAGVTDSADEFYADVMARNGNRSDPALTRRLCERSGAVLDWLADGLGLDLVLLPPGGDPGHRRQRLHAPTARDGHALIDTLSGTIMRRGVKLRLGTPVLHLWTDTEGGVLGVQVKSHRRTVANIRCHTLLLASDGFGANSALLGQHVAHAAGLTHGGAATSTGDALLWGADVGAASRDLGAYYAYPYATVGANLPVPWDLLQAGAILVNQSGERFVNELLDPMQAVPPIRAQPGRIAYVICDASALKAVSAIDPHFAQRIAARAVRRAAELAGLASQFQIGVDALTRSVDAYNTARAAGTGDAFGRSHFGPPLDAPFFGIRVSPALFATQGGLVIDVDARVLRPDGTPVPALYAGGGAASGLSGPDGDGYLLGNGLLCALGLGEIAGEHAAAVIRAARPASSESPEPTSELPPP